MIAPQLFRIVMLIVAVLVFVARPAAAQGDGPGFGIKGGYLYTSLTFDDGSDVFVGKTGWIAGLFVGGNRDGRVGLMGELNLLRKSARCEGPRGPCGDDPDDLYYVQLPAVLRVNVGTGRRRDIRVYGIGGSALEIKIGEDLGSMVITEAEPLDVSLVAGVGVELERLILEVRGTWGLRDIARRLYFGDPEVRSQTFSIMAGFRIN